MKALEFKGSVVANGQIEVPPQIAQQIPEGAQLQILLSWGDQLSTMSGMPRGGNGSKRPMRLKTRFTSN